MKRERLIIAVSGRRMSVDLDAVEEIADCGTVTLLPQLPPAMPGVIGVRGRVIPVIDIGVLSGDPPRHDRRSVLIMNDGIRPMALLIDAVEWTDDEATDGPSEVDLPLLDVSSLLERIA